LDFQEKYEFFFAISLTDDVIYSALNTKDRTYRGSKSNAYSGQAWNFDDSVTFYICADPSGIGSAECTVYYFAIWYTYKTESNTYTAGLQRKILS